MTLSDTDHRRGRADRRLLARTTAAAATAAEHADPRWLDPPAWPSGDHAAARPATQRTGRGAGGRSGPFAPGVSGVTRPCLTALFTPASWPSPQPSPVGLPQLPHGVGWRVHFSSIFIYVHTAISLTCVVKPKPPKVSADSVALALRAYLGAAQARVRARARRSVAGEGAGEGRPRFGARVSPAHCLRRAGVSAPPLCEMAVRFRLSIDPSVTRLGLLPLFIHATVRCRGM